MGSEIDMSGAHTYTNTLSGAARKKAFLFFFGLSMMMGEKFITAMRWTQRVVGGIRDAL